jgi:N-acetylglutamate synthase-like GNAT family acetyltransferase
VNIHSANPHDELAIRDLLQSADLVAPVFGSECHWWVMRDAASTPPVACIGAEAGTQDWLLRSAYVLPAYRRHRWGRALTECVLTAAQQAGMRGVYCFSTDAGDFWQHLGFAEVPVATLLNALPRVPQVMQFTELGWLPTEVAWYRACTSAAAPR